MNSQNNILLISDNKNFSEKIGSKILLLRNIDNFIAINYDLCLSEIQKTKPCVIFFHFDNNEKELFSFLDSIDKNISVILIFKKIDEDILCSAYEKGISDFLTEKSSDSEYTVRVLWALQKQQIFKNIETKQNILAQLDIIDYENGLYTKNYINKILKEKSKKNYGSFAAVAPDINTRNKLSPSLLASIIKKNIRSTDIIGFAGDFKLYLWFEKTRAKQTSSVFKKIKKELPPDCTISAGIVEIEDINFENAEEIANKFLSKALLKGNCFLIEKDGEQVSNQVPVEKVTVKNFKQFKKDFHKNIDKILSPLFFQTQKRVEEKFFETKVEQNLTENDGHFSLKSEFCESYFAVTYPGYTKLNIDIIHKKAGYEDFSKRICLNLDDVTYEKISSVLDEFIITYQKNSLN